MFFTCLFFNCLIHFCLIRQICSCTRWHILSALGIFPSSNKMLPGPCTWISSRRDIHTLQTRWTMSWLKWTSRKSCYAKVSIHTPDCWSSTNQWPKLQTFFFQLPASRPPFDDHWSLSDSHTMPIAHWHFLEWSQPVLSSLLQASAQVRASAGAQSVVGCPPTTGPWKWFAFLRHRSYLVSSIYMTII